MIPLFSIDQVRNADRYAIEQLKIPSISLMENASLSVFNFIKEYYPSARNVGVICGRGNNGGDGFATARHLINDNHQVTIIYAGKESELNGDALLNYTVLKNLLKYYSTSKLKTFKSTKDIGELAKCDLIVDALLGTGTKGELREPYKSIIQHLNEINIPIVSIDLPSGLNLDKSSGSIIVNAELTVTLADYKTGLFYGEGYKYAGKVVKGSIGIGSEYFNKQAVTEYLIEPEDALVGLPNKDKNLHKYSNGKILVIAGSGSYPGAAALTTNSILKSGGGAVFLAYPKSVRSLVVPKMDEAILLPYEDRGMEILSTDTIREIKDRFDWADLISIGPGLGRADETIEAVEQILKKGTDKRFVIDADAIYAMSKFNLKKTDLRNKVLTPHHAEFSNLIGISNFELENDLMSYGRKFVREHKCTLVLKGAPSIIFTENGDSLINSVGNVGMAKFGTGDVLTGIISGLSAISPDFEKSIISAVYLHSLAADLLLEEYSEFGITPTLIMENLHNAIKFLRNSFIYST